MRFFLIGALLLSACGSQQASTNTSKEPADPVPAKEPAGELTAADADAFVAKVEKDLRRLWVTLSAAEWEKSTNITDENEAKAAAASTEAMQYLTRAISDSRKFDNLDGLSPDTKRQLHLLRLAGTTAPNDPAKAKELADLTARMESLYGKGKVCKGDKCRDLAALDETLRNSRNPKELLEVWTGWRDAVGRSIGPLYKRFVVLANEGAQEVGFADMGARWRSGYDMAPDEFEKEIERLWSEVKPLYDPLHCYVRSRLVKKYGKKVVPPTGPIPAHLLGNMWAQSWNNVFPLVEPYKGQTNPDVTKALVKQGYSPTKMVKLAEAFFTSVGMDPLPQTFWERSMFVKPPDREVVCHASAWDLTFNDDVRIKMCIRQNQEDLITIHHELGHDYYFHYYHKLPVLYQNGAHDGFHEAIGDAIALSITPEYWKQVGLLKKYRPSEKATINGQMYLALEKIAFLPWGLLVDKWRWDVFGGKVEPDQYNDHWWALRKKYQGVAPPTARGANDFDPGAKYHIPANVPYTRYFLSFVLQFQFHRALCKAAGHTGPLHTCSIYGSKEAGKRMIDMLSMGSSKPWRDAMEAMTGTREMSGDALVEYFTPLITWLEKKNRGKKCGW